MKEVSQSFVETLGFREPQKEITLLRNKMLLEHGDIYLLHILPGGNNKQKPHDFTNIPNNQTLKALTAKVIAEYLGYEPKQSREIIRASLLPNWNLYLTRDRFKDDFSDDERKLAQNIRSGVRVNPRLEKAAGPIFFIDGSYRRATDEERVMVLASDAVEEIKPGDLQLVDPIAHMGWKRQDRADLGDEYWDREERFNLDTFGQLLPGINPEDFPSFIQQGILDLAAT